MEKFPKNRNLMINSGGIVEERLRFPRKYLRAIMTCAWKVSNLMSSSVLFKTLFLFLGCATLVFYRDIQVLEMGGEPRKQELSNCRAWKAKAPIWKILEKGNVTTYLECLHGYKPHITKYFFKKWFEERVNLHGVMVNLTKDLGSCAFNLIYHPEHYKNR